jgi:UDP-glucose 4-epimerase
VLPIRTALLVAGRVPLPVLPGTLRRLLAVLWALRASEASAPLVDYLLYPCVADGGRAARELKFRPTYSTQESIGDHVARGCAESERSAGRDAGRRVGD